MSSMSWRTSLLKNGDYSKAFSYAEQARINSIYENDSTALAVPKPSPQKMTSSPPLSMD
jgi:hypothetical protein